MWFSGKRYRRIRCENIDTWMKSSNVSESLQSFLMKKSPVFSFTKIDENNILYMLQFEGLVTNRVFRLGEEQEVERIDGTKVKLTFTLEGDNVMNQIIKLPDGKVAHFRREFGENETKMTINMEGSDITAAIYFEEIK